jgi:hypothetical protein
MPKKLVEDTYNGYMNKLRESLGINRTNKVDAAPSQPADQAAVAAPAGGMPNAPAA